MTRLRLILRNLGYFRAANLAVIAGMGVATAVLTGALMVGDSVRGSLRALAVERLGPIEHVLYSSQFFPQGLAERISSLPEFREQYRSCVAGVLVRGGVTNASGTLRAAGVQIAGVEGTDWLRVPGGEAIINTELAGLVLSPVSSTIVVNVATAEDVPRDATFARRSRADLMVERPSLRVKEVAGSPGVLSHFSLAASQRTPRNAWMNLGDLQEAVGQPGRVNMLLVEGKGFEGASGGVGALNEMVRRVAGLGDYGLGMSGSRDGREAVLSSRSTYLSPAVAEAVAAAAKAIDVPIRRVSVYLANKVVKFEGGASGEAARPSSVLHYCIIAGIDSVDGQALGADEMAINEWTAEHLGAKRGDMIRFDYYHRESNGELKDVGAPVAFRVGRILPMTGLGADPTLTPVYKGFTDADTIGGWKAPQGVEINKKLVTAADEEYWEKHKASPKLFVNLETARGLWGNAFGDVTSVRVPAGSAGRFAEELLRRLDPGAAGLYFQPIKAEQLAAAGGGTDFAGLFVGFSFFLIGAAALLAAMLFRLAIEGRARQLGLLGAVGFSGSSLQRLAFVEGGILAVVGAVVGGPVGVGYTWVMVYGLRTWWVGAVGTTALHLHVEAGTLIAGLVASFITAMVAVYWAVRRISRSAPSALLSGAWSSQEMPIATGGGAGGVFRVFSAVHGSVGAVLAAVVLVVVGTTRPTAAEAAFPGAGALLLVAALLFTSSRLRAVGQRTSESAVRSVAILGFRNASRHGARSVLTMALIAFATFTLVVVASMRQSPLADTRDRQSGTGGYQLMLGADVALPGDLNTRKGRDLLALRDPDSPLLSRATFTSFRSWAGQDVSCLNLTRPTSPTILAAPRALIERRGFTFAGTISKSDNPWELLDSSSSGDVIPVVADNETATYILKLNLGETLPIRDELGRPRKLRLVATLAGSIFQSQLLMGERDFVRLFLTQSGFGTVLVECPNEDIGDLQRLLSTELDDFAVTVESTSARLARYQEVANTYLSTFEVLGSLGLMLGTIGLAVVLLRNLIERRAELALLSALGFRPAARLGLVLSENILLLVLGLLMGTGAALGAVLPSGRPLNYGQLWLTLSITLALGMLVLTIATVLAGRRIGPGDLRVE